MISKLIAMIALVFLGFINGVWILMVGLGLEASSWTVIISRCVVQVFLMTCMHLVGDDK
jgi:hypothetical protein